MKWSDMAWPIPQEIIKPKNVVVFDVQRKEADRGGWKPSHRCQGKNRIRFIWQQWWPCQSENLKKKKKAARVCVSFLLKRNTHQGSWLVLLSAGPQEGALEATRLPWSQAQDPPGWKVDEIFSQESKSSHTWIVSKSLCSWMLFFWGAGARCAAYRILVPRPGIESVPRCHGRMGC